MEFYSVDELRSTAESILEGLSKDNDVIITNNGKPYAVMMGIPEGRFDETIRALRQAKALAALERMRSQSPTEDFKPDDEIEKAIGKARES